MRPQKRQIYCVHFARNPLHYTRTSHLSNYWTVLTTICTSKYSWNNDNLCMLELWLLFRWRECNHVFLFSGCFMNYTCVLLDHQHILFTVCCIFTGIRWQWHLYNARIKCIRERPLSFNQATWRASDMRLCQWTLRLTFVHIRIYFIGSSTKSLSVIFSQSCRNYFFFHWNKSHLFHNT